VRIIPDLAAAQAALESSSFDPRREVILESGLPLAEEEPTADDRVEIALYQPQRVVIQAASAQAGYLLLADLFYPGWQARVDGKRVSILRADGVLRAVYLPAGEHTVELIYRPASFFIGGIISLGSVAVWAVLLLVGSSKIGEKERCQLEVTDEPHYSR